MTKKSYRHIYSRNANQPVVPYGLNQFKVNNIWILRKLQREKLRFESDCSNVLADLNFHCSQFTYFLCDDLKCITDSIISTPARIGVYRYIDLKQRRHTCSKIQARF